MNFSGGTEAVSRHWCVTWGQQVPPLLPPTVRELPAAPQASAQRQGSRGQQLGGCGALSRDMGGQLGTNSAAGGCRGL